MNIRLIGALFSVYVIWGATFLGMRVGVETIPPMVLICLRFVTVGFLMLLWAFLVEGQWRITRKEWKNLLCTGIGLFTFGNGLFAIALQYIPSSIATLIGATGAVWMVLFDWFFTKEKPGKLLMCGLLISLIGIFTLAGKPETSGLSIQWLGVCIFGGFMWNFSAYSMRLITLPKSTWLTVGWQNILGGLGGAALAAILGEWDGFSWSDISARSWMGVAYLVLLGSMIGFTSYQWLVVHASPMLAATTVLVNPVVAMFFGWLILDEPFTFQIFCAFLLVLTGVIAIIMGRKKG